jgi:hypothetical protein
MSDKTLFMAPPKYDSEKCRISKEIKDWFGDGEVDVDLMIATGVVTEEQILTLWKDRK